MNKKIAITAGDFNGIGPEVIIKALNKLDLPEDRVLLIGASCLFNGLNKDYEIEEIPFEEHWLSIYGDAEVGAKLNQLIGREVIARI